MTDFTAPLRRKTPVTTAVETAVTPGERRRLKRERRGPPAKPAGQTILSILRSFRFTGVCSHCGKESVGATLRDLLVAAVSDSQERSGERGFGGNTAVGRPEMLAAQHFTALYVHATRDIVGTEVLAQIVERMRALEAAPSSAAAAEVRSGAPA